MLLHAITNQRYHRHPHQIIAQHIAQILQRLLHLCAPGHRKELQGTVPRLAFPRQHEENQERNERGLQDEGIQRTDAADQ